MTYDYYYDKQSETYSFFSIPRLLITDPHFKRLSIEAKLLYGLLLDRMKLSAKNGWYDDFGRVYIYYTVKEIQEDLCCGHEKAGHLLQELDNERGIGLIERVKRGQGKPTIIYVKQFIDNEDTSDDFRPPITGGAGVRDTEGKTLKCTLCQGQNVKWKPKILDKARLEGFANNIECCFCREGCLHPLSSPSA